jgi:hypothetical protein
VLQHENIHFIVSSRIDKRPQVQHNRTGAIAQAERRLLFASRPPTREETRQIDKLPLLQTQALARRQAIKGDTFDPPGHRYAGIRGCSSPDSRGVRCMFSSEWRIRRTAETLVTRS